MNELVKRILEAELQQAEKHLKARQEQVDAWVADLKQYTKERDAAHARVIALMEALDE